MPDHTAERWVECPVEECDYSGAIPSVAGHVSGKKDSFHDWGRLGYDGANHFKRVETQGGKNPGKTRLLHMADTHLGKEQGGYGKRKWPVNCTAGFRRGIEAALTLEVDAVLHTGDLFHNDRHGITKAQVSECRRQLSRLDSAGISFYYILGDHERDEGARLLQRFEGEGIATHLTQSPRYIGGDLALYGTDFAREDWWDRMRWAPDPPTDGFQTILGIHQSLKPLSKSDRTECDVRDILNRTKANSGFRFDAIALGHLHKSIDKRIDGCRVICGGATERIGGRRNAFDPFVGIFEILEETHLCYLRHELNKIPSGA